MIELRDQRDIDSDAVRTLVAAAFGDDGRVADLAAALRGRPDTRAGLVACDGNELVGHTQLSISWLDTPQRLVEVLVLSPLSVTPAHQRTGIGTALQAAVIERATRLGAPAVFLEGDPRYYGPRGWRPASEIGVTPPSVRIPAPACQVVTLGAYESWMTGALVYNDTFWTYDCVGLRPD